VCDKEKERVCVFVRERESERAGERINEDEEESEFEAGLERQGEAEERKCVYVCV